MTLDAAVAAAEESIDKVEEICRVCRCEGTDDSPLFYPCKCSGSIKYVHQECLVEWLKHSKKRYCELCKHSFTFSPIYREQMPTTLPIAVVVMGVAQRVFGLALVALRILFVSVMWGLGMPLVSSLSLHLYLGWNLQSDTTLSLFVLSNVSMGLGVTAFMVVVMISLMLLRDYMHTHRLFRIHRRRRRPVLVVENAPADGVVGGDGEEEEVEVADTPSEAGTTTSRMTARSSNWLQSVTPREYRNYLRRRDHHRARVATAKAAAQNVVSEESGADSGASNIAADRLSSWENDASSSVSGVVSISASTRNENQSPRMADPLAAMGRQHVSMRDNFRCRICNSSICIKKDHVVSASLQQQQQQATLLAEDSEEAAEQDRAVPIAAEQQQQQQQEEGNWMFFQPDNDDNNGNGLTIYEFFGLQGSIGVALQNMAIIVACNIMVMHIFVFLPRMVGRLLLAFDWSLAVQVIRDGVSFLFPHLQALSGGEYSAIFLFWVDSLRIILDRILAIVPHFLTVMVLNAFETLKAVFRISELPVAAAAMEIACGFVIFSTWVHIYQKYYLRRLDRLSKFQKATGQLLMLLGAFLKMSMVLVMELGLFPLYCGWLFDASSVIIFGTSLSERIQFQINYPLSSTVVHWIVGITVLVNIAMFVKWCRTILRPGVLYFIRNTDDPDVLPLKDILEKPMTQQLKRFAYSSVMYAVLVGFSVYGFASICRVIFAGMMIPVQFSFRRKSADVPFELIVHLFAKLIVDWIAPRSIGVSFAPYLQFCARQLRLSSFLFGGRYLSEESMVRGRWRFVPDFDRYYKPEKLKMMAQRVVEPLDIAVLPIKQGTPPRMEVNLNSLNSSNDSSFLVPRRPAGMRGGAVHRAEESSSGAGGLSRAAVKDFTVVYCPSMFAMRIYLFLLCIWIYVQSIAVATIAIPVMFGRLLLKLMGLFDAVGDHDMYAFGLGFIVLGVCCRLLAKLVGWWRLMQLNNGNDSSTTASTFITLHIKDLVLFPVRALHGVLMISVIAIVWPVMTGWYVMKVVGPFMVGMDETAIVPVSLCWTIGGLVMKIGFEMRQSLFSQNRNAVIDLVLISDGWTHLATMRRIQLYFLIPYTIRLAAMVAGPPLVVLSVCPMAGLTANQVNELQRWSYLLGLMVPVTVLIMSLISSLRQRLMAGIREDAYMVGRRLHNLERPTIM